MKAKRVSEDSGKVEGDGFVHFAGTFPGRQAAANAVQTMTGSGMNGIRFQADYSNSTRRQTATGTGIFA